MVAQMSFHIATISRNYFYSNYFYYIQGLKFSFDAPKLSFNVNITNNIPKFIEFPKSACRKNIGLYASLYIIRNHANTKNIY